MSTQTVDSLYSEYFREQAILVNIYGPNRDNELVTFYRSVLQTIEKNKFDEMENTISGGDFNCPLTPLLTKEVEIKPDPKTIGN